MIKEFRSRFNNSFQDEDYQSLLDGIREEYGIVPSFRVAETPVVIPESLRQQLVEACNDLSAIINRDDFKEKSEGALRALDFEIPGENEYSHFLQMDFAVCKNDDGTFIPQLIELQGFPSLYFFQDLLSKQYQKSFRLPERFQPFLEGIDHLTYRRLLRELIVGPTDPQNVILLEIEPEKQATYIDFLVAQRMLGIPIVCVSKLIKKGRSLWYENDAGEEIPITKIFSRVIFDEWDQKPDLPRPFDFKDEVDVEWIGHPNWFFRISKYTLPLLKSKYVPDSYFLHELDEYPTDLKNYVLKPLYSFAGSGVNLNLTKEALEEITDRENYILQKKIEYGPVVETPDEAAKCEIRMLMLWDTAAKNWRIVNNLVRLSKGEMIGVRYNKDKEWVGGSIGFFDCGK